MIRSKEELKFYIDADLKSRGMKGYASISFAKNTSLLIAYTVEIPNIT